MHQFLINNDPQDFFVFPWNKIFAIPSPWPIKTPVYPMFILMDKTYGFHLEIQDMNFLTTFHDKFPVLPIFP